jgi:hypothetical protein
LAKGLAQQRTLFAFARARSDAVVGGLPIHYGPRNVLNLIGYVVNDGQLLSAEWKCIRDCFVCHFKLSPFDALVLNRGSPTLSRPPG